MKALLPFLVLATTVTCGLGQNDQLPSGAKFQITEIGPHTRTWTRTVEEPTPRGEVRQVVHRYVELGTGLNYLDGGVWKESKEEIEIIQGHAVARQGQHKVIFAGDIATPGAIDLEMPGGERAVMHVLGLSYFDQASGQSVLLAEVKSSTGIVDGNTVVYMDAFSDGVSADIRYTYTKNGLEQDVLLTERLPFTPEDFGMSSQTTVLQVLTEFVTLPRVIQRPERIVQSNGEEVQGEELDFGTMRMSRGDAFRFDAGKRDDRIVRVQKLLRQFNGRDILIEQVPIRSIADDLRRLPPRTGAVPVPGDPVTRRIAAAGFPLPAAPKLVAQPAPTPMLVAQYRPPERAFLIDYQAINSSLTNLTLQADTSYYVSARADLYGTTRIEGGCVIKFAGTMSQDLWVHDALQWESGPYRPAVFTSKHDDSVGEILPGSTGNPTRLNHVALVTAQAATVRGARILFARVGLAALGGLVAEDVQWVDCGRAIATYHPSLALRNALVSQVDDVVINFAAGLTATLEQVTADTFNSVLKLTDYGTNLTALKVTNSLFTVGTNWVTGIANPTLHTNAVAWLTSHSGVYQTAGAGRYYLADGSPYRNVGATNLSPSARALVATRTTYPPLVLSNTTLTMDTTLSPQAQRDTDQPDLGYHAAPLDYLCSQVVVTNALLRLTPGTALGYGGGPGVVIAGQGRFEAEGTVTQPITFTAYAGVQEQPSRWPVASSSPSLPLYAFRNGTAGGEGRLRLVQFFGTGLATTALYQNSAWTFNPLSLRDCQFYHVHLQLDQAAPSAVARATLVNNLFVRSQVEQSWTGEEQQGVDFQANTLRGGSLTLLMSGAFADRSRVHDNLLHETVVNLYGVEHSHNAYATNAYAATNSFMDPPCTTNDLQLASFPFAPGPLGNYYLPANSPLIDAGSMWATNVGLYHHTTQTNQTKEANSRLDIGFHYVPLAANGLPYDFDGDGIPDYSDPDADGDGVSDLEEIAIGRNPLGVGTVADTAHQTGLRTYTPMR